MLKNLLRILKSILVHMFKMNQETNFNIWLFSSSYNEKFNYNSKYLFEFVLKNEPTIKPLFVINNDVLRKKLKHKYGDEYFIETNSLEGIKTALAAGVWFTSAGLPVYSIGLKTKRLIINLWHGVPLKKIGLLDKELNRINKFYFKLIFSNNYSYVITTASRLKPVMAESFGVSEEQVKVLGQPRNDQIFMDINRVDIVNRLCKKPPNYKKIILYAPTFRTEQQTEYFPFKDFDLEKLSVFLEKENLIIFIKPHQSEVANLKGVFEDKRIKIISDKDIDDIMEVISIFDLLITDYSSIYIDYLLTEKPILFLPYDYDSYESTRGFNFNYFQVTPGPKPKSMNSFITEIKKLIYDDDYYLKERRKVNSYFNEVKKTFSNNVVDYIKKEIRMISK